MIRNPFKWGWIRSGKANFWMSCLGDYYSCHRIQSGQLSFQLRGIKKAPKGSAAVADKKRRFLMDYFFLLADY